MRYATHLTKRLVATAALTATVALGAAAIAPAASAAPADPAGFGLHVIADPKTKPVPATPYGAVRIWDIGVTWGKVQQSSTKWWWTGLDQAIANARSQNVKVLYVLGSTPKWVAGSCSKGDYPNKGAACVPSMSDWKAWVTAVAKRYKGQGLAYQIWNEANLKTMWSGSPQQLADLTQAAKKIIRQYDSTATVVAASTTVRLTDSYNSFFPAYLKGLKKNNWPVDVYSAHLYPDGQGTPATRAGYIAQVKQSLAAAGAPARPLWDTEVNYGFAGPGSIPGQTIDGDTAAAYVSQTYLDDLRLGVARAYWYSYTLTPYVRGGVQLMAGTAGTNAYATTFNWVAGGDVNCVTAPVNTCTVVKNGAPATIAWAS
ncbi:MAG: cellulase family glycosylhydrolase, partial [Actinomycetales bacterium]